jgi:hypothetical protein
MYVLFAHGRRTNEHMSNRGPGSKLRVVLGVVAAFVVITVAALAAAVWIFTHYMTFEVEEGKPASPVKLRTILGDIPLEKGEEEKVAGRLDFPVYPGSVGQEHASTIWNRSPTGKPEDAAICLVLRFRSQASLAEVDLWYRAQLGRPYLRKRGWSVPVDSQDDWTWRVQRRSDAEAVHFQDKNSGYERGVLLTGLPDGAGTLITVYEYREANRM